MTTTETTDQTTSTPPRCEREKCGAVIEHREKDARSRIDSRRFCSAACYRAHWRETYPTKPCPVCGEQFGPSRSEARAAFDQRKTCSKSCAGRSRRDGGTSLASSKKCAAPGCEVTFERKSYEGPQRWTARRFCSRPCSTNHRETHRVRVTPSTRSRPSSPRTRPASTPAPSSPFGDRPPAQPWRPAGFSATPNTRPGGAR